MKGKFATNCYCCSIIQLVPTLWDPTDWSLPGLSALNISWSLPKFMSIESVMPSSHLILWRPLLLLLFIFPSTRDFSNESANFSFSISPSNKYSRLISLKIGWIDLAVRDSQETSSSTIQRHQFSVLQLLYGPAVTTVCDHWENHSLNYMDLFWHSDVSAFQHIV